MLFSMALKKSPPKVMKPKKKSPLVDIDRKMTYGLKKKQNWPGKIGFLFR